MYICPFFTVYLSYSILYKLQTILQIPFFVFGPSFRSLFSQKVIFCSANILLTHEGFRTTRRCERSRSHVLFRTPEIYGRKFRITKAPCVHYIRFVITPRIFDSILIKPNGGEERLVSLGSGMKSISTSHSSEMMCRQISRRRRNRVC